MSQHKTLTENGAKMNPDVKAKWVAALRSGVFKQGRGMLWRADGDDKRRYCCLGVLRNITKGDSPATAQYPRASAACYLSDVDGQEESVLPGHTESVLAGMNDEGKSFAQIADFIEANL